MTTTTAQSTRLLRRTVSKGTTVITVKLGANWRTTVNLQHEGWDADWRDAAARHTKLIADLSGIREFEVYAEGLGFIGSRKTERAAVKLCGETADENRGTYVVVLDADGEKIAGATHGRSLSCPMANLPRATIYTSGVTPLRAEQWAHLEGRKCGDPECDA